MSDKHVILTKTVEEDLYTFFKFQLDEEARFLAAFTPNNHADETAYIEKHTKFLKDPNITNLTIKLDDQIVGSVAKFMMEGEAEITYWIDRKYWGKGIATKALTELLKQVTNRPIYGRVAFDNYGSQKVLEKCGFVKTGTDKGFANARQEEIEEYIYKLSD